MEVKMPDQDEMSWPTFLTINAWTGEKIGSGKISSNALAWTLGQPPPQVETVLLPPPAIDLADWHNKEVGWGLILPEKPGLSKVELAEGTDAPEPIQVLLKARPDAPLFRYLPSSPNRFILLRDYKHGKDVSITTAVERGVKPGALPHYMLIYGDPAEIPWQLQYILNATCATGRLDLKGEALENYVKALLDEWQDSQAQLDHTIVWAVDHGPEDITRKLKNGIAAKVQTALASDTFFQDKAIFIDDTATPATTTALINALAQKRPQLIVTTSHGQTGPLNNLSVMRTKLGLPVDHNHEPLEPEKLLANWEPDGAIWYAHACCSAGSIPLTIFEGLLEPESSAYQIIQGVTQLGALTAPLPQALLGAKKPLRAFIGHVEPTFDWTIRQSLTGQYLTNNIKQALYNNLYTRQPVGLAFREYYKPLAALYTEYDQAFQASGAGEKTEYIMLYARLAARDLQSMVILGDPTATLPVPA
jgi:hypothetical protein